MHVLRSVDYPLPPQFNAAFEASQRLAFEVDPRAMQQAAKSLERAGKYPAGDSLKNHVDPRTYAYLTRLFALLRVPEKDFAKYRPWYLSLALEAPGLRGAFSHRLGVEEFLTRRALANRKPISGLESARESVDFHQGMTDAQAEATLLLTLIPRTGSSSFEDLTSAWRRGDAEFLWRVLHDAYRDFPSLGERLLEDRNRRWIPNIERFIASGETYFVVVGAAHMGGPQGVLALLKARGYRIEQL